MSFAQPVRRRRRAPSGAAQPDADASTPSPGAPAGVPRFASALEARRRRERTDAAKHGGAAKSHAKGHGGAHGAAGAGAGAGGQQAAGAAHGGPATRHGRGKPHAGDHAGGAHAGVTAGGAGSGAVEPAGPDGDDAAVESALEPPPPPRFEGTRPVLPSPPTLDQKQLDQVRTRTGLTVAEHYARVRERLEHLGNRAEQEQRRIVAHVEDAVADVRRGLEEQVDRIPDQVRGALRRVQGAYAGARGRITSAASEALATIEAHATASDRQVNQAALTSREAVQAAVLQSSPAVRALYDETMRPLRSIISDTARELTDIGNDAGDRMVTHGEEVATRLGAEDADPIRSAVNEAKAELIGPQAQRGAEDLRHAGTQKADDVRAQETSLSLSFLALVNPASVHIEQTGTENQQTMTSQAGAVRVRLASDYEQARRIVEMTRDRAVQQLDGGERSAVQQLTRLGRRVEATARSRIDRLCNGMQHGEAPAALAWAQQMDRVNRSVPAAGLLDARRMEPVLDGAMATFDAFTQSQRDDIDKQTKEKLAETVEALDGDRKGIDDFVRSAVGTAWSAVGDKPATVRRIGQSFAAGFRGVAQPMSSEAQGFTVRAGEELGAGAADVRKRMADLLDGVTTNLNLTRDGFRPQLDQLIDNLEPNLASQLADVDPTVVGDLARRSYDLYDAMEGLGTNETKLFGALHGLTARRGRALEAWWPNYEGESLREWLHGDLSGDSYTAALAYLGGDRVAGAAYELSDARHWYGDDVATMEAALRGLTPADVARLQDNAKFREVAADLQHRLSGTDLDVVNALSAGNVARADALRLRDTIDQARAAGDDDALHDALAGIRDLPDVQREFRSVTSGVDLATYATRDVQVYVADPEGAGGETVTMHLSDSSRALATALATQGEGSPEARAARLAFEVGRGGSPRLERLETALNDPALVAARRDGDLHSDDPQRRQQAEQRLARLEQQRDAMMQQFARLQGTDAQTAADPASARDVAEQAVRRAFGDDAAGAELGASMVRDGRARPALAVHYAIEGAGTNEALLRRTLRNMTPDDIQELRQDYADLYGHGNLDALYDDLGVFQSADSARAAGVQQATHGGFFTELSGDERQEFEEMLLGVPQNDRDRWRLARLRAEHQEVENTTWFNRDDPGLVEARGRLARDRGRLDAMVDAAGGEAAAFDEHGNFRGIPNVGPLGRPIVPGLPAGATLDAHDFRVTAARVGEGASAFKHDVDAIADRITTAIAIIGAIVGGIVVTALTGGAAAPLVIAGWAAGIAALTGAAAMAVNWGMKGGRYGWEQASVDAALTLLDAATAGLMAGAGAKAARAAAALTRAEAAATGAAKAAARQELERHLQRDFVAGFVRAAATSGISGGARTALADGTWDDGILRGLGRVVEGGLKAAAVGTVTHGVTSSIHASSWGKGMSESGSILRRGFGAAVAGAAGGMAGRATDIGLGAATGEYHGTWVDALGEIATAGGRDFAQNFAQGAGEEIASPHQGHGQGAPHEEAPRAPRPAAGADQAPDLAGGRPIAAVPVVEPEEGPRRVLRDLAAEAAADPAVAGARQRLEGEMRREVLAGVPPELHGELAGVPIHVVSDEAFERFSGSRSGRAVTVFVDGEPHIVVRAGTSPEALREEGIHVLQSRDPAFRERIGRLDETNLARWHELDLETQLSLYRDKIEVEIDGQQRLRQGLVDEAERAGTPELRAALERRIAEAEHTLGALRARRDEVEGIGPARIAAIQRGEESRPQYLEEPARLFSKGRPRDLDADELHPERGPRRPRPLEHESPELATEPRHPVALENTTFENDYPPGKYPGYGVNQVGEPWQETERFQPTPGGPYENRQRDYRMVEVVDASGRVVDRRREILQLGDSPRWQQRGSESTAEGRAFEEASRRATMAEAERQAGGRPVNPDTDARVPIGALRSSATGEPLSAQHGGGAGFDDVVITFRQRGGRVEADITVIEAKHYRGNLSLEDFSAITGNLPRNLTKLAEAILGSNLSPARQAAALEAIAQWRIGIQLHVGEETSIGALAGRRDSVLRAVSDTAAAWRALDAVTMGARGIGDADLARLHGLRTELDASLHAEPFDAGRARAAIAAALGGTRTLGLRYGVPVDDWRPAHLEPFTVAQTLVDAAQGRISSQDRLGPRPLGYALGTAERLDLASGPYRAAGMDVPPEPATRAVLDGAGRALVLTSPPDVIAGEGAESATSRGLVRLLGGSVTTGEGAPQRPEQVVWDATLAKPREVLRVLDQIHEGCTDPADRGRLRVVLPRTPEALRAVLGASERVGIAFRGDEIVLSLRPAGTPPETVAELRRQALSGVPEGRRAELAGVPIRVIGDEDFTQLTGSRTGRAVTLFIDGEPHIVVRAGAPAEALREEGIHVLQSRDPGFRERIARLDETTLGRWRDLDLETQMSLYRDKLEVEIDGQQRLRQGLAEEAAQATSPEARAELERRAREADGTLAALRSQREKVEGIGPARLAAMRRGDEARPGYLDEPARLFSKGRAQAPVPEDEIAQRARAIWQRGGGDQEAIRRRAYAIWESEGRPPGRDLESWLRAEAFENWTRAEAELGSERIAGGMARLTPGERERLTSALSDRPNLTRELQRLPRIVDLLDDKPELVQKLLKHPAALDVMEQASARVAQPEGLARRQPDPGARLTAAQQAESERVTPRTPKPKQPIDFDPARPDPDQAHLQSSLDVLRALSGRANDDLVRATDTLAGETGGRAAHRPGGAKDLGRVMEKIHTDYGGDPRQILDLSASTIVYERLDTLYASIGRVSARLEEMGLPVARLKDRFISPQDSGFRDVLMNLRTPNGAIVELRLSVAPIFELAGIEHAIYEVKRPFLSGTDAVEGDFFRALDLTTQPLFEQAMLRSMTPRR